MSILDSILEAQSAPARVVSEQHDVTFINFVNGLSDPGEMISCGYLPAARRQAGEQDAEYAERIRPLIMALPLDQRNKIMAAAIRRASLDTSNGRVALMVAGGDLPWTRLGVVLDKAVNSKEAMVHSSTNWKVEKLPMSYVWGDRTIESRDDFALVRADTGARLNRVGKVYKPIQNEEAFSFVDDVLAQHGAKYASAGAIHGGRSIFLVAHMPKQGFTVNGRDVNEAYVAMVSPHGDGACWIFPTNVRIECANTNRIALGDRDKGLCIRHTGSIKAKVDAAKTALGMAVRGFDEFKEAAEAMARTPLKIRHYADDVLDAVLEKTSLNDWVSRSEANQGADVLARAIAKTEEELTLATKAFERKIERRGEVLEDILERYEAAQNASAGRGTAWAAYNAVTDHVDHNRIGRQVGSEEARLSRRFESSISGRGDDVKQIAYELAMAAVPQAQR